MRIDKVAVWSVICTIIGAVFIGGIVVGTHAGPPPCASEDSAGPCVWDAQTQGNGQGRSFEVLRDGTVVYK